MFSESALRIIFKVLYHSNSASWDLPVAPGYPHLISSRKQKIPSPPLSVYERDDVNNIWSTSFIHFDVTDTPDSISLTEP
jgi:hypothetical protein